MLRLVLVFVIAACFQLLGLTSSSFSQNQPQQNAQSTSQIQADLDRMVGRLNSELNLSVDQQKKIRAIFEKTLIMAQSNGKAAQRVENKGGDIRKRFEQEFIEIKKVLTPEQQKKYNFQLPPEGTPMAPASEELFDTMMVQFAKKFNLTTEQQVKIKAIHQRIFPETIKTAPSPGNQGIQQKTQEEWQKRLEQQETEIKKVLTPEQQKKYEATGKKVQNGKSSPQQ